MRHEFGKPYVFEEHTFEVLDIPIESMTGADFAAVKKQWSKEGGFSALPAMDSEFCARVAARLAHKPIEFFEQMPASEYCKITQAVSNFLLS